MPDFPPALINVPVDRAWGARARSGPRCCRDAHGYTDETHERVVDGSKRGGPGKPPDDDGSSAASCFVAVRLGKHVGVTELNVGSLPRDITARGSPTLRLWRWSAPACWTNFGVRCHHPLRAGWCSPTCRTRRWSQPPWRRHTVDLGRGLASRYLANRDRARPDSDVG
jgi:hypothetical protein